MYALLGPPGGLTVCRRVEPLLYGQLASAEDAAHHSAPKKLPGGGGGIHHGVLVLQTEQGIPLPINGVLRQPGDRPLDDLLPALVQHGVHPLPEYALVVRRQGVDTAAGLHDGVEKPGQSRVGVGPAVVRPLRLGLLILVAGGGEDRVPELWVLCCIPHRSKKGPGHTRPSGDLSGSLHTCRGSLGRRAGPCGEKSEGRLWDGRYNRRAKIPQDFPDPARLLILRCEMFFVCLLCLLHVVVQRVKRAALIELVISQQGPYGLHDRPLQHGQRGGDACGRLIRTLEHHALGDLSPVRLAADPLPGEPDIGPLSLAAPAEAPAPGGRFFSGEVCRISDGPAGEILPPLSFQRLIQQVHPGLLDLLLPLGLLLTDRL